jgi:predicted phage baseplate assembly protein
MVDRESISLLATRPLGVKEVTNPLAATDAEDPETREKARVNAPLTVLTLDRVVSLQDFEDFARAFLGIAKARADWVWDGSQRVIHVTVAGTDGTDPSPGLLENLRTAMDNARDPFQPLVLSPLDRYRFRVEGKLLVDQAYDWGRVAAQVEKALEAAFCFDARDFAQGVPESDVVAIMQRVDGVKAVDLDKIEELTDSVVADDIGLPARPARYDETEGKICPAELMILGSPTAEPIKLTRMP